jgi:protein ImuB
LLERLNARLGPGQVHQLHPVADHRPERATAGREVTHASLATVSAPQAPHLPKRRRTSGVMAVDRTTSGPQLEAEPCAKEDPVTRPVWLLDPPQPLPPPRSAPPIAPAWLEGHPLRLLAGPERIESGWWDGPPVVRDYFIAQTADGALVWVYRSRLPEPGGPQEGWFLQGRFA